MVKNSSERNYHKDAKRMKTAPGITDLKNLREFRMTCVPVAGQSKATDVTGYYAFAAPDTRLQRIFIEHGASISDTCQAAIKQRLGLCSVFSFS